MAKIRGFFNTEELQEIGYGKNLVEDPCMKCGLFKEVRSPKMPESGEGGLSIFNLFEAPGEDEDLQNKQLVGRTGQLYRERLSSIIGIELDRDCIKDNSVRCRPLDEYWQNRKPTKSEIKHCKIHIDKAIQKAKPKFIWLNGKSAVESFYMDRFSDTEISDWRGLCIPDRKTGAYVIPFYHATYLARNENDPVTNGCYNRDLEFAFHCLTHMPYEHKPYLDYVFPLTSYSDVMDILTTISSEKPEYFGFDYESTGLKPFNAGHKIACISGCDLDDYAFSFLLDHPKNKWSDKEKEAVKKAWVAILLDPEIKKIMQNAKFEDLWSRVIFKIPKVVNITHCTMNSAHIIASQRPTNLKWQTYIHFGIDDYSKGIKHYLEDTDEKGFNKIFKAPVSELLLYSALDSLFLKWLFNEQQKYFKTHPVQEGTRRFFQEGLDLFTDMQMSGINTDREYYAKSVVTLSEQIKTKNEQLLSFKEVSFFEKKTKRKIDFESSVDLRILFFDIMGLKSSKQTATGLEATDKEVVNQINHPIAKTIVEKRKLKKQLDYAALFFREINDDGRIRPFFNLHIPVTGRSSSDSPNWQNIPVRDEEAKKVTRLGIIPSKGNRIMDWDYAGIEVKMAACYTKDPTLIAYIKDPKTDMHRDTACDLFMLDVDSVTKEIRFYAKNGFVFPEFYGSYYVSTARILWQEASKLKTKEGKLLLDHLKSCNIYNYQDFEEHVKQVEKDYWIKFKIFKHWQREAYESFAKTGIIDTFFGFRISGFLGKNDIINYRFQASAFHCLLWSIIEINKELKKRKLDTKIIGQVHDCCLYDMVPEEKDEVMHLSYEIATQRIRKEFSWIIVPLDLEFEVTDINQSWYYKKEIKFAV